MSKVTTHEIKKYTTELGDVEIEIHFDRTINTEPLRTEVCHGSNVYFDDSDEEIILTSVELLIPGAGSVNILAKMNLFHKNQLIENL